MKAISAAAAVLTLMLCLQAAAKDDVPPASTDPVPAGAYVLDPAHASLIFRVDHLGFSHYTARFKRFDAQLKFDPAALERSSVTVTVDARSIETDYPDPLNLDFNAVLQGPDWLDTVRFPEIRFRSKAVTLTGPRAMRIDGELDMHGVTRPVTLEAVYNGGYAGHPFDPHARIGFSARGTLKRSEFGIANGIPAPGTTLGVSDAVEVIIETEFNGPPLAGAAQSPKGK